MIKLFLGIDIKSYDAHSRREQCGYFAYPKCWALWNTTPYPRRSPYKEMGQNHASASDAKPAYFNSIAHDTALLFYRTFSSQNIVLTNSKNWYVIFAVVYVTKFGYAENTPNREYDSSPPPLHHHNYRTQSCLYCATGIVLYPVHWHFCDIYRKIFWLSITTSNANSIYTIH